MKKAWQAFVGAIKKTWTYVTKIFKCVFYWLKWIFLLFFLGSSTYAGIWLWQIYQNLPGYDPYFNYNPYQTSYILDKNGKILGCKAWENGWRDIVYPQNIKNMRAARIILAAEDKRFYSRNFMVFDLKAIIRAQAENYNAGKIVEGGSTIPQQLVKQLLSPEERFEKTYERKIKEVMLAFGLFWKFNKNKDAILALYLSEIAMDHQRYGVEAAARFYFNKTASELTISEAAVLASMIKSPATRSPTKENPARAKEARDVVLFKSLQEKVISKAEYEQALKEPIVISDEFTKVCNFDGHLMDYTAREINKYGLVFDPKGENEAWHGIRIHLTIDKEMQIFAKEGVKKALETYHAKYKERAIDAEGAFLTIENGTGAILAMVGGNDYSRRKFNHVFGDRQDGSSIKPFIYSAKFEEDMEDGKKPETLLDRNVSNAPMACRSTWNPKTKSWTIWSPRNFDEKKFRAANYSRRMAIAQSINRPAVWTAQVGKCALNPRVTMMVRRLGITSPFDEHLPSALGASSISLYQMVRAYSVFPNKGSLYKTYMISKITNFRGEIIAKHGLPEKQKDCGKYALVKTSYKTVQKGKRVVQQEIKEKEEIKLECGISEVLAGVMVDALRGTVKFGTARSFNSLPQPVAGKTGTTEGYKDAWFIGFTTNITFGGWVGGPESYEESLGDRATGGSIAGPISKYVLENWYAPNESIPFPEETDGYLQSIIDPKSLEKEMKDLGNIEDAEAPSD